MFLTIFFLVLALTAIAFIGLGVQVFFSKKKAFPETKVGHNKALRKQKIFCVKTQQAVLDKNYKKKSRNVKTDCASCNL